MFRAKSEHGPLTTNHFRALALIGEEIGEVNRAILEASREDWSEKALHHAQEEIVQVMSLLSYFWQNLNAEIFERQKRGD